MDKIVIKGGNKLTGEVKVEGAKNAVLPILTASLLASDKPSKLVNVPALSDVETINNVLTTLNADVTYKKDENAVVVDATKTLNEEAPYEYVSKMRASILVMGPLLARLGHAIVALPGGCAIGSRPIEQHIKGFEALGAHVEIEHGAVIVEAEKLIGTNIFFDVVSVGATINVMLAATLAEGNTVLENVAKEPHVVDVANFLNSMGANIKGAGTDVIRVTGVKELKGCTYSVIPDQIEAGTYMIATAACGGEVTINNVIPKHLESITAKLIEMGVDVIENGDSVTVKSKGNFKGANIKTQPYPGFPTDVQQPMSTLLTIAKGRSIVNESIWESRFKHVDELKKMGANIKVEGRTAIIDGVPKLTGAIVKATDLRAGAAMVIAGLLAEGDTEILGVEHIDRGYPNIENKFKSLGATIVRL